MKIIIRCSEDEREDAEDVRGWIRDGEFVEVDGEIDVEIEVES